MFKEFYRLHKTYLLAPAVISSDHKSVRPLFELGIHKAKVEFRNSSEIGENDIDSVVLRPPTED